jgi:UDP-3-O-[3-hydroxymyristoyl] glucosamine N-acyltransferase
LKLTAAKIAELIQGTVVGDSSIEVDSVAKIEEADSNNLCFVSNKKYINFLQSSNAGIVLVNQSLNPIPEGKTVIRCDQPYVAFCQILIQFFDYKDPNTGIHPTAVIEPTATVGNNCHIGAHAYIGNDVVIGDNTKIYANTSIYENTKIGSNTTIHSNVSIYYDSVIGDDCILHSGAVIGSDGFGHAPLPDGTYIKIPQIGNVIIGNKVEIGSNSSIDRANMGSTIIHDGCRLDNLIQIAHGVEIGKNSVIAGHVAIAGSTKVGENCVVAGQAGIVGHVTIAKGTHIGAQSGVSNDIKQEGSKITGTPHMPVGDSLKAQVVYKHLPALEKRVRELENIFKETKSNNG